MRLLDPQAWIIATVSLSPDSPLPCHYQLANLNWHPTVDMKVQSYALEQQAIEREQRMKQLRKENVQIMNETEQLRKENARLSELDAKLNAILSSSEM